MTKNYAHTATNKALEMKYASCSNAIGGTSCSNAIRVLSGTTHVANDLVATVTTLLTHSHQPTWNSLTLYQQTSIMLAHPPTTLPKKFNKTWLHATLPHILTYIAALETHLYNIPHALQPP